MYRLWLLLLFVSIALGASSDDGAESLRQVRENVAAQLKKSANYTCVQTIDRSYFKNTRDLLEGCAYESGTPTRKEVMHDRLRLDVAVSEGSEIYSWHGENKFSSSEISRVVSNGPISSGSFIGFLYNIFVYPGVQFSYLGRSSINGGTIDSFDYTVPLLVSHYHVHAQSGTPVVPFHGSFSVNATTFELTSLKLIADVIPGDSNMCSAETDINYQNVNMSGKEALIPASFVLRIDDTWHIYTVSRNEYSQCREFRGESTIRFDHPGAAASAAPTPVLATEWLPAGMTLNIGLRTPVNEKTAYTGDPVEGVLLASMKLPGSEAAIPKGATLTGIITKLEEHYEPEKHYFVRIEFQRLAFGNRAFLLRASHKPSPKEGDKLYFLYGEPLPAPITEQLRQGTMIFDAKHFRLGQRFSAEWETKPPDR